MNDKDFNALSNKLNVIISLNFRLLLSDKEFRNSRKKGTGEFAKYLSDLGLDAKDISLILGAPIQSIRTLLTPKRRK